MARGFSAILQQTLQCDDLNLQAKVMGRLGHLQDTLPRLSIICNLTGNYILVRPSANEHAGTHTHIGCVNSHTGSKSCSSAHKCRQQHTASARTTIATLEPSYHIWHNWANKRMNRSRMIPLTANCSAVAAIVDNPNQYMQPCTHTCIHIFPCIHVRVCWVTAGS